MKKVRLIASAIMMAGLGAATIVSCTPEDKVCPVGYEGKDCETLSRAKMVGVWNGNETCTVGTDAYKVTITTSGTSEIGIVLSNIYNQSFTATGTMTGENGFSFSGSEGSATYSGTGTLNESTGVLTLTYNIAAGVSNACTFTGTKL